ncbi:hypothetical protein BDFB_010780 [Asbolus verrucosus]|uniref:Uncharacterized protein n=1 Tax=Asbolus verrucosus TaxID=1661398 RepID=A0A482VQG8_ASBVE|nr:hypothetical protein BDFB_010780 [Asbolus verrucosus]
MSDSNDLCIWDCLIRKATQAIASDEHQRLTGRFKGDILRLKLHEGWNSSSSYVKECVEEKVDVSKQILVGKRYVDLRQIGIKSQQ